MKLKITIDTYMWIVFGVVISLYFSDARGQQYLDLHITSYHFDRDKERNEFNYGIGITDDEYSYGYYKNSNYNNSFYIFKHIDTDTVYGTAGLNYGLVTGYEFKVTPIAVPYTTFGPDDFKLIIGVLPNVITFSLQIKM